MNFIFFGTNRFSAIVLEKIIKAGFIPCALVTAPDAPVGRKQTITPSPAKLVATQYGIAVLEPASLKDQDIAGRIASHQPAFAVVAAYAKLIPQSILNMFPQGILNVHPSLLPLWRGPSPIESAIMHGDMQTGTTIILLDQDIDHGPILAQEKTDIDCDEYFEQLYQRLALQGSALLTKTIPLWLDKKITPQAQDHRKATFSRKLSWQDGKLDTTLSMHDMYNRVRALSLEPGAWIEIMFEGKSAILKISKAKPLILINNKQQTTNNLGNGLVKIDKKLCLQCKDGYLELEVVQPQSGKPMTGGAFLNGYRTKLG